ncbi:MAG TPA: DUF881 domain-containing protein [Actinomycetota bacterium]|nr:DUF881 domain-containing protein [Actinomycetota bacterium]
MSLQFDPGTRDWRGGPRMRPESRLRTRALAVLLAGAVGFLVGVQAGTPGADARRLETESTEDLTRILSDLNAEADRLAEEVAALRLQVERTSDSATREEALLDEARGRVADLQVLAGSTPVRGPGIELTISDEGGRLGWDQLLDAVQELRDAGAEAIAIGGERVVASTWLAPGEDGIVVGGRLVRPPYRVRAIGPGERLQEALEIAGGPLAVLAALPGVDPQVSVEAEVRLPALRRPIRFRYARAT